MPQYTSSHDRSNGNSGGAGSGTGAGTNNKKKFGKNLNKLVKPAAPPIPSDKLDRNVKNGLLLLSTKKPTSGLLASKTNATISANTSNGVLGPAGLAAKTGPALNLHSQSSPSTHQVLLSAVVGASQGETQKLDAWGVADQLKEQQQLHYDISRDLMEEEKSFEERDANSDGHTQSNKDEFLHGENHDVHGRGSPQYEENASWDEYGGRGQPTAAANGTLPETDEQRAYMSRLAKERAQMKLQEEEARIAEQKARANQRLKDLEQKQTLNGESKNIVEKQNGLQNKNEARTIWEPENKTNGVKANGQESAKASTPAKADAVDIPEPQPLIHLASYEDRDRGERGTGAAPRMLYDPKSGSMVEVKSKPESAGIKPKKVRAKGKKERDTAPPEVILKNGRNKQKARKDPTANVQVEKKKANPNRRFPRTRGVLYKRDGKGGLRSADECDGDLGYGAHSVPGGRIRNAEAYDAWVEENKSSYSGNGYAGNYHKINVDTAANLNLGLSFETGYAAEEPQPILDWVKANDKIELLTGVDDSPTLKPTAKEWAPSVAAIAAAVAAANAAKDGSDDTASLVDVARGHEDTEDEEESDEADDGLGFDPLQGIDFMSSPANLTSKSAEELATVDLPSLALDPPVFSGASSGEDTAISRSFFAFGSSGTWSSDKANNSGLTGWGSSAGGVGLFGSDAFGQSEKDSLLAGASSSWGTSAVPGLDRLPAINASEHTGPAD
ncbi:hypothetical protein ACA910_017252 [Epithemia clementina (nom. ined.)]